MENIGTEHFEASLQLKGLEHRIAQHFIDYSGEIEATVQKCMHEMIANFDLEKEIRVQFEIQYKKHVAREVERIILIDRNKTREQANKIIKEIRNQPECEGEFESS